MRRLRVFSGRIEAVLMARYQGWVDLTFTIGEVVDNVYHCCIVDRCEPEIDAERTCCRTSHILAILWNDSHATFFQCKKAANNVCPCSGTASFDTI